MRYYLIFIIFICFVIIIKNDSMITENKEILTDNKEYLKDIKKSVDTIEAKESEKEQSNDKTKSEEKKNTSFFPVFILIILFVGVVVGGFGRGSPKTPTGNQSTTVTKVKKQRPPPTGQQGPTRIQADTKATGGKFSDFLGQLQDFQNFPIIRSKTTDNSFQGDSARGNGYCSIWSILIGWSLLNRNTLIINREYLRDNNQPTNMKELVNTIINTTATILNDLRGKKTTLKKEGFTFSKGELEFLDYQLKKPESDLQTIAGRAQFQILALLLGVEIIVHDETTNMIDYIGNPENDTIRVSTNGAHYHVRNNKQNKNLNHFTNRYWWDLQWRNHPIIPNGTTVIAYIPEFIPHLGNTSLNNYNS